MIIPTLDEERVIGGTLAALSEQDAAHEVIVSDGGSVDRTQAIVRERGDARLIVGTPGRARQLDRGARRARFDLLLFLHADTRLPAHALREIAVLAGRGHPIAGGFPHRYSRGGPLIRLASLVHSLRSRLTGVYYGDQAPFVSRSLFERLGGFGDLAQMEDVDFGRRVRRHARPYRMPRPVLNSPRKLEARGVLRSGVDAVYLLACLRLGLHRRIARHAYFEPIRD